MSLTFLRIFFHVLLGIRSRFFIQKNVFLCIILEVKNIPPVSIPMIGSLRNNTAFYLVPPLKPAKKRRKYGAHQFHRNFRFRRPFRSFFFELPVSTRRALDAYKKIESIFYLVAFSPFCFLLLFPSSLLQHTHTAYWKQISIDTQSKLLETKTWWKTEMSKTGLNEKIDNKISLFQGISALNTCCNFLLPDLDFNFSEHSIYCFLGKMQGEIGDRYGRDQPGLFGQGKILLCS